MKSAYMLISIITFIDMPWTFMIYSSPISILIKIEDLVSRHYGVTAPLKARLFGDGAHTIFRLEVYIYIYSGHLIIQNSFFQHYLLTLSCILTEKPWYKKTCSTLCLIVTTPLHGLSRTLVTTSVTILLVLGACARSIMEKLASYIVVTGGQISCWIREKRFFQ